ncbi:MAG: hypothetical protein ACRDP9_06800 [Kribbellaceae bacterium]
MPQADRREQRRDTMYMPVTNPDTLADVCRKPSVCSSCATPYVTPSATPRRRSSRR